MNIVVNVIDVDDHAPRFQQFVYNCSVRENSQPLEVTSQSICCYNRKNGAEKLHDMKMQVMKMMEQVARYENAERENTGHTYAKFANFN